MLRSYLPKDHPLKHLEIGSEATPAEYVAKMVKVFDLVRTAMSDHAVAWINVGDTYSGGASNDNGTIKGTSFKAENARMKREPTPGIAPGNLCLIPQRLAISLQDAGWLVRSVVIWHKKSPMPQSVSGWKWVRCRVKKAKATSVGRRLDRVGDATNGTESNVEGQPHAQWSDCPGCPKCEKNNGLVLRRGSWRPTSSYEPILMLAKSPRYFSDGEPVKTPPAATTVSRDQYTRVLDDPEEQFAVQHDHETVCDGANARDVQSWAAEALKEKHYASFPTALVAWCLKAGTSARGYCPIAGCGAPWVRVIQSEDTGRTQKMADGWDTGEGAHGSIHRNGSETGEQGVPVMGSKTIGWRPSCQHADAEPRPALVCDPFCGSGRTGIAAARLGLDFVGVDLNQEYVDMAARRIKGDCPLFN